MKKAGLRILVILAIDLIFTSALVLALAALAYKMSWEGTPIGIGVVVIYILVNLAGGGLAGKTAKTRRFLWGALEGILYFAVVAGIAWLITRGAGGDAASVSSILISAGICAVSGMAGGMFSRG